MLTTELAAKIHDAGTKFVLAVTGGGAEAITALFTVPGASRSMLSAIVPYSEAALVEWLHARPENCCTARTARVMAMEAFVRARKLAPDDDNLAGVACTASLASDRPKRGAHRFFVAVQTLQSTRTISIELTKGARSRAAEEAIVARVILNEMAVAAGLEQRLELDLQSSEEIVLEKCHAEPEWQQLLFGPHQPVAIHPVSEARPLALLPGAFNPLHHGHQLMREAAERILDTPVAYELSVANVDKPPLDYCEIERRVGHFQPDDPLYLTAAPTFVEKSRLWPGVTFVVGIDTLERIAEGRYYGDSIARMLSAISEIGRTGGRFLVFGRQDGVRFRTIDDLSLPPSLQVISEQVPEDVFRVDVSSTELRRQTQS